MAGIERFEGIVAWQKVRELANLVYELAKKRSLSNDFALRNQLRRASDSTGSTWGTPLTVDSIRFAGEYAKLIVANGFPAIAYRESVDEDLRFVIAKDADGANWQYPIVVDSEGDMGRYVSLAIVNGRPCIAYRGGTNQDALFAYSMTESAATGRRIDRSCGVGGFARVASGTG